MIELKNISFRHENADVPSLKNVSLTIADGECVLLCGESGSGKTTITRLINGLIPHFYEGELEGIAMVNGLNVTEAELYETAKLVGSVFQNPRSQFFCVDTTSELAFGCENMGMPENEVHARVDAAAKELKIENLLGRSIFELSGGEKQKIACASVSALRPQVMVLDEPTSNLDLQAIKELKQTLLTWKAEGKTIVIAEHRLSWLKEICDRVICMKDGEVDFDIPMTEFEQYSAEQLHKMGLRSLDDNAVPQICSEMIGGETLELRNFCFSYDGVPALHIPQFTLPVGGIIAVIGNNGAGKSTFSRCLCGLEKRCGGTVQGQGRTYSRKERLKLCYMVMQDVNYQLFSDSVREEILLGAAHPKLVDTVMQALGLNGLADRHPMSLSGGQKQRVVVAAAMLSDKPLILLDEPTSGLDRGNMEQVGRLLQQLKTQGKTIVVITHDEELAADWCDRIIALQD